MVITGDFIGRAAVTDAANTYLQGWASQKYAGMCRHTRCTCQHANGGIEMQAWKGVHTSRYATKDAARQQDIKL